MGLSLAVSTLLFAGVLGPTAQALSPMVGLATAFAAAPAIAWATRGRYYLARPDTLPASPRSLVCTVC